MIEQRRHSRTPHPGKVRLWRKHFRRIQGQLKNMSEGGIYVEGISVGDIALNMFFEVKIIGEGWANDLPPLTMKVVRIDPQGVALQYYN